MAVDPAPSLEGRRQVSAIVGIWAVAIAAVLALLALAWLATVLRIGADADAIRGRIESGGPLRQWQGAQRGEIVPAGSHGKLERDAQGLTASSDDGLIELSLNTRGWPIHGGRIGALGASIDSDEPIDIAWFGYGAEHADQRLDADIDPRDAEPRSAKLRHHCAPLLPAAREASLQALRLRITSAAPSFQIRFHNAAVFLQPRCDGSHAGIGAVATGTALGTAIAWPESLLRQRTQLAEAGALWVEPPADAPRAERPGAPAKITTLWVALTLLMTGLGGWLATRSADRSRLIAPLLVLAPVPFLLASSAIAPGFRADVHIALFVALLAAACMAFREPRPQLLGSASAWRNAAIGVAAGATLLALAAWHRDGSTGLRFPVEAFSLLAVLRYSGWALLQQWILVAALLPAFVALVGARAAIPATAIAFAALHTPNAALMLLTALAGLGFAWHARRHRSLLPLAIAHALLATLAIGWLMPDPLRNAEIGGRYYLEAPQQP